MNNRLDKELNVLTGKQHGDKFSLRLDHIALILLPLGLWYETPSAWYDLIDVMILILMFLFSFGIYCIGLAMVWIVSQSYLKVEELSGEKIKLEYPAPKGRLWVSVTDWKEKPDLLVLCVLAVCGWSYVLLSNELYGFAVMFIAGCVMFPVTGLAGRRLIDQKKAAVESETSDEEQVQ